jgi:hypothetical protein
MRDGKLIQMDSKMCPVDWNTQEFENMMSTHLKKDECEWKFYDELVLEWNAKNWENKPLSAFLKFMLDKVSLEFTNH